MNNNGNGIVPLLGQKAKAGVVPMALIHHLDPDGTFEPEAVVQTPAGPTAVPGRANVMSATDLLAEVRAIVREEIRAALAVFAADTIAQLEAVDQE